MKVYVAIAREGGIIDDIQTFPLKASAREALRKWQKDMTRVGKRDHDHDLPEEGEFEDSHGVGFYFDIFECEMPTKTELMRILLDEILISEILGDPEDPDVSEEMRSLLLDMRELTAP